MATNVINEKPGEKEPAAIISEILPPKTLQCLVELLRRAQERRFGEVTIRFERGKPVFIVASESYCPEKECEMV